MGEWKFINITCQKEAEILATAKIKRGDGRSLNLEKLSKENDGGSTVQLVVALAVVAALLCAVVVLVGLLLVRRRMLSGPGSLNPLVRSSGKQQPPLVNTLCRNNYPGYQENSNQSNYADNKDILNQPSMLQQNLLATLQRVGSIESRGNTNSIEISDSFEDPDYAGLGDCDPPYERVRSQSEHSYETIRKKSLAPSIDLDSEEGISQDPGYETVLGDKESVGYESVKNEKDVGYETVRTKNHEYETLKEKDPGYETVKEKQDPGYETVSDDIKRNPPHGYETLKPKHTTSIIIDSDNSETIPDILQNLASDGTSSGGSLSDVPPEIQALYAKVDKSKKKNRQKHKQSSDERLSSPQPQDDGNPSTDVSIISDLSSNDVTTPPTRDLIKKFNKMSNEDDRPKVNESDFANMSGTLRPLPPLPGSSRH